MTALVSHLKLHGAESIHVRSAGFPVLVEI